MEKSDRNLSQDRIAAEEALIERQQRLLKRRSEYVAQMDRVDLEYREEMSALIGEKKINKHMPQHKKLLSELERPSLFDASPEGLAKEEKAHARIVEQRHKLYRSIGFPHEKAIQMRRSYLDKTSELTEQFLGLQGDLEYVSRNIADVPKVDNPWTHYTPPYFDEWGTSSSGTTRGSCWGSHSESRWTAAINCNSYTRLVGADDSDNGWSLAMSEVWVRFRMPAAGLIEIVAVLQDNDTRISGALKDESGCSDGRVRQLARSYLWTSGGVERYNMVRDSSVSSDGSNRNWDIALTDAGDFIYPHIFSSQSYAQGQWVTVAIGVQDDTSFRVNDMSVNTARIISRYFVKDIYVRSTGAP